MINTILLIGAAAMQMVACPPVSQLSKAPPVGLRPQKEPHKKLIDNKVPLQKDDTLFSTSYVLTDNVPTSFHVIRSPRGLTRVYAICAAPWGEMLCAKQDFRDKGESPHVFVRNLGKNVIIVVRYQEKTHRRYEVYQLDQSVGFKKRCG